MPLSCTKFPAAWPSPGLAVSTISAAKIINVNRRTFPATAKGNAHKMISEVFHFFVNATKP